MPETPEQSYLPVEDYEECLAVLHGVSGFLLVEFARQTLDTRELILRNFIARADTLTRSVFELWAVKDYQGCWVLHRCLLDRLFHLSHLRATGEFEAFEAWSFLEQYDAMNRLRSDPEFAQRIDWKTFGPTKEQEQRARSLAKNRPSWRRPKPEDVAKKTLEMRFLYAFGYDYGSAHVHPMADDGNEDFHTITGLTPSPEFPDQRAVLHNSLLVGTMILQEALNASSFRWRALVYNFIDDFRGFLGSGATDYRPRFLCLAAASKQTPLCEPSAAPGNV